jgi:hypothetical protein
MKQSYDADAHSELIELQEELLKETIDELRESWGKFTPGMKKYYREFKKETTKFSKNSDIGELIEKVLKSDIVYSGDYHTLGQSQSAHLKILSEILKNRKDIVIGLEMVYMADQELMDQYVRGELVESEFLEKSKYYEKWGFDWKNYKPILQFAIKNGLEIIGLNYPAYNIPNPLYIRDKKAAEVIARISAENPEKLIFVIFGDMHVASIHLPREVKLQLEKRNVRRKDLIIFQNIDEIYFRLVKEDMENKVDVVMLNKKTYCIMNTTPYIKYQSRIHWCENMDYYVCKFYDIGIDKSSSGDDVIFEDDVDELMNIITKYFFLSKDNLPDFEVYSYDSKILFDRIRENDIDMKSFKVNIKLLDSFYINKPPIICLGRPNTNHMAEQATIFLYYINSLFDELNLAPIDLFFARIIINALGFLGSKLINPKRKCSRLRDYELFLERYRHKRLQGKLEKQRLVSNGIFRHYEILLSEIDFDKWNYKKFTVQSEIDRTTNGLLSKAIGQILGENLFYAILQELTSRKEIRKLFFNDFEIPKTSFIKYIALEKSVKSVDIAYQSKDDRF